MKDFIKAAISILLIAATSFFGIVFIKNISYDEFLAEKRVDYKCQVTVKTENSKVGRGVVFRIGEDYIDILTSKHLVSDSFTPVVEMGDYTVVNANITFFYADYDAAILRVSGEGFDKIVSKVEEAYVMTQTEYDSLKRSDAVFFADNIHDEVKSYREGQWIVPYEYLEELECETGIFAGKVDYGMSGEGLFDINGNLIGIIIGSGDYEGAVIPGYKLLNEVDINE